MSTMPKKIDAIIRARRATANTLLKALQTLPNEGFSEKQLAQKWLWEIKSNATIRKSGWYLPPPHGMSVLIGNPPDYNRLRYNSLREIQNWPSSKIRYSKNSLLYPYFSAVDRETYLIGDFVGTFYQGEDMAIRNWIKTAYKLTMEIAKFMQPGQKVSDIYYFAQSKFNALGISNNTYSQSGGVASDIGHSIPGINTEIIIANPKEIEMNDKEIATRIATARTFISGVNNDILGNDFGFTIEPQLLAPGLPMASFHLIVLYSRNKKTIVNEFDSLFDYFGMSDK